ncbi:MAG: diacylglycerol kinase [Gammaproteobacteria bacterium]|nr:diacylglycerol kinase [Gammaproteobacteria bacterium]
MKPGKTGLARIIDAFGYSLKGLKAAWQNEAAFRQEVLLAIILIPAAFFVGQTAVEIILLILCVGLIFICELVNSALEAAIDRFGGEIHELSGRAKDIGSAIVLISFILTAFVWSMIIYQNYIV